VQPTLDACRPGVSRRRMDDAPDVLLEAIAGRRDRQAFARLFTLFAPRVKGWLMARGASATDADEVAQDVLLTVWRQAARFDPGRASASTWIFTIARNKHVDRIRKQRRPSPEPEEGGADAPRPDEQIDARRREVRVRAALATLPDEQARVIHATWLEGRSQREFAEDAGLPVGTVKSRTRLAFRRLLSELDPDRGSEP
jgi:RNA polymerase sigma factor (sigma-70 family)